MSVDPSPKSPPIWRVEALSDYEAPAMPTRETLRKKFAQMLKRMRPARKDAATEAGEMEAPSQDAAGSCRAGSGSRALFLRDRCGGG